MNKQSKTKIIETENRMIARGKGSWEVGKMGEGSQEVQTCSYKITKSWGWTVSMVTAVSDCIEHI